MSLSTSLTLRYSIALVLVALILATTHMLSVKRIESSSADGHLIDTSGMQRMLSQRIGLLSLGMLSGRDNDGQSLADDLLKAINKMKANHNFLKEDWQERAEAGNSNFGRLLMADGLSDQVDIFLQEATDLYNRYLGVETASRYADDKARLMIIKAEKGDFLASLDGVVKIYTHQTEETGEHLHTIETYSLALGVVILLFEVLFIFRPMVNRIATCVQVLDEANEELLDLSRSLSSGLKSPIVNSIELIKLIDESLSSGKVTEAATASGHVYTSMVTMDGVIIELLEVVNRHRTAVLNFTNLGSRK